MELVQGTTGSIVSKFRVMRKSVNTAEAAFEFYDSLPVVKIDEMTGRWAGSGFATGHIMDGTLEAFRWYGKEFIDADNVHPLIFRGFGSGKFFADPKLLPVRLATVIPGTSIGFLSGLVPLLSIAIGTSRSRARLRMIEFRGKVSAAMLYDNLPINDVFRKVDQNTLLGCMDYKGMERPLFFVLEQET